jgi:hypothetical protein
LSLPFSAVIFLLCIAMTGMEGMGFEPMTTCV